MKMGRRSSKRIGTRTRKKIDHKVREHNRKVKKRAKKEGKRNKKTRDVTVPRMAPFKQDVLKQIEKLKAEKLANKQQKSQQNQAKREQAVKKKKENATLEPQVSGELTKKHFTTQLNQILGSADLIIEVLDARDPEGTRCRGLERRILSAGKGLILLLNKVDLIPRESAVDWMKFLKREHKTLLFKAIHKHSKCSDTVASHGVTDGCIHKLFAAIKTFRPNSPVVVGVVGMPNVGKSSVVNCLRGMNCCEVGSIAGITRHLKEVKLNNKVRLIDSPGVVVGGHELSPVDLVLLNCVDPTKIENPVAIAEKIISRCGGDEQLVRFYRLPISDESLLDRLCKKCGYLKKGGETEEDMAAMKLIRDWTCGRLPYHTNPPEQQVDHIISSRIISVTDDCVGDDHSLIIPVSLSDKPPSIAVKSIKWIPKKIAKYEADATQEEEMDMS